MNIKQLLYFTTVAEERSISNASRKLEMAQPPISRQISLLEDELGVCLFLRNNKGIELTEAGESLYFRSKQILKSLRDLEDSVKDIDNGTRGILRIGTIYSNIPIVLEYLRSFRQMYPLVELYIRLGTPKELLNDLNTGDLNFLFLRAQDQLVTGIQELVLGEDPLELVMTPRTDPAPNETEIPIEKLKDTPMCLLRSDDLWGYNSHLLNECHRIGLSPTIVCECYDTPMAMQLVLADFGISYLPRSIIKTHPDSNLITKPIRGLRVMSLPVLMWGKNMYRPACQNNFLSMIKDCVESEQSILR